MQKPNPSLQWSTPQMGGAGEARAEAQTCSVEPSRTMVRLTSTVSLCTLVLNLVHQPFWGGFGILPPCLTEDFFGPTLFPD